jgi:hypothetical protein
MGRDSERVPGGGDSLSVFDEDGCLGGICRQGNLFGDWTGGITDEGDFLRLSGLAPGGVGDGGAWEAADVKSIAAISVTAVATFANLDDVASVFGDDY